VTAWFSYTLLGDGFAAGAFAGDDAEILDRYLEEHPPGGIGV
jgi:hypothetical protein